MQPLLVTTHLLVLLATLLFIGLTIAEPAPSPAPAPAIVFLPSRPTRNPAIQQDPEIEHDLLPFVLISTIDGALHAVERDGGKIRWSLRDGVQPLVGGGIRGTVEGEEYIVEPLSGDLYTFEEEAVGHARKMRRLPLSVEQL
jgi:serine/threonine-protein kinase/endoribonuclease IRE1